MQSNAPFKFAPVVNDERRIDLSIKGEETVIKLSTWTDGLGWCTQKTMSLDPEMLDEMHRVIAAARSKVKRQRLDSGDEITSAKVLAFPNFS
ncbi:MAG TPA: hypothetical protein VK612_09505 [Pyrinomonadaceae bacterium]|nr:hypothetical protein [Pyrinomonadaceae bacterium]